MKAITIHQPWASLIAVGAKRFETRSWKTNYLGLIAIHAGLKPTNRLMLPPSVWYRIVNAFPASTSDNAADIIKENCPFGVIIATAELVECWKVIRKDKHGAALIVNRRDKYAEKLIREPADELVFGDFSPRRYAWELANIKRLETPIPAKGKQGLWNFEGLEL
jgi:hypothetical protein